MGGFAWVTLATNDSYSLGALVLAHSLKQAGTVHQLAVLITPGVTRAMREKLETVFNVVKEVNVLDSRDEANLKLLKRPELGVTFTKLHCWTLTEFDKCVFLDADTLVLQNADELFERDEFSAAPDVGWPDCFNSGVFVYRPSLQTYESLIQFALERGSFDGGDQGVLNLYFSDWAHKDISKHLPFIYNMCSTACYSYLPAFKQFGSNAKIMHFIGSQKPWLQYFNTETRKVQPSGDSSHLEGVLQRWWDIFCSLIHPHLSPAMAGLAGAFSQLTLGVARTAEQDALENVLRKQAWEVGNIDYLGKDSFDNIWSKISETLSSGPAQSQSAVAVAETPAEVAPSAPAESQSQTVQQEAQPSDKTIEKIQSNLTQEQTKTPETDEPKPAQPTCPMTPKSEEQEPIVCPLVQPEVPALTTESPSPKTESPPVLTKAQTVTPEPPVSSETPKVETQEAVADPTKEPTTAVQETASLKGETEAPIEQPPASLITSLLPKEETPTDTVVPQVLTETLGTTEQAKEQVVVEKEPVPAPETPKQQPQALPEPVKEPSEAPKEQPQVLSEPVKDTEAPKEPAQVPSEPLKEPSEEQPQVLSEPAKVQPKAVSEPLAASTTEQSQFVPLAPKEEPPKPAVEPLPLAVAPPVSVEQPPKGQLAPPEEPIVATPPIPAPEVKPEAPKPEVEDVKPVAKGVSEAQAEAAAPSKEKSEESQEAAKGATPTPPPRKTDKPKKGAAKSKK